MDESIASKRGTVAIVAVSLLIAAAAQWYLWNNTADDAFILFRYAARFVHGEGLTFNPGERVEGYSCPLWLLLLSGINAVTSLPFPLAARLVGIMCEIGVLYLSWKILRIVALGSFAGTAAIFFAIIILTPGFHYFAGAGLETPLLALLLVLGIWAALHNNEIIASIAFGLAGVTRPEGILYIAAWLVWRWFYQRKSILPAVCVSLFFVVGWEVFRVVYYGVWAPNTAIAKFWHGFGDFGLIHNARFFLAPFIVFSMMLLRQSKIQNVRSEQSSILALCLAIVIAGAVFVAYAGTDWMFFGRFVIPFFPVAALLFSIWISTQIRQKQEFTLVLMVFVVMQLFAWARPCWRYINNEGFAMLMRSTDPLRAAAWVRDCYPGGTTIATDRLGAMSFVNYNSVVWDFAGLTDREEAIFRKNQKPGDDPILNRNPHLIVELDVPADWSYRHEQGYLQWLEAHYSLVHSVPQGHFGTSDFWEKKDNQ